MNMKIKTISQLYDQLRKSQTFTLILITNKILLVVSYYIRALNSLRYVDS